MKLSMENKEIFQKSIIPNLTNSPEGLKNQLNFANQNLQRFMLSFKKKEQEQQSQKKQEINRTNNKNFNTPPQERGEIKLMNENKSFPFLMKQSQKNGPKKFSDGFIVSLKYILTEFLSIIIILL